MSIAPAQPVVNYSQAYSNAQVAIFVAEFISQVEIDTPQGFCALSRDAMEGIGLLLIEIGYDAVNLYKQNA